MEVIERLTDVVLIVTGFQLLLLAVVVLLRAPTGGLRRTLLAAFLLTKAFLILRWSVVHFEIVRPLDWPNAFLTSCAVFFLLAPVLYLYVRATCRRDFRLRWAHFTHALPFAAMAVFALLVSAVGFGGLTTGSAALDVFIDRRFWTIFWCANLVQILLYIVAMCRVLRRYRQVHRDLIAVVERDDLVWLQGLLVVISCHWIFVTSRSLLALMEIRGPVLLGALDLFSITIFLVYTTALVVNGLRHVKRFPGIEETAPANGAPVSLDELEGCAANVAAFMKDERPHLDPFLSLDELALRLSVAPWQLSRSLNTVLGKNFFHFVNGYRVDEAKGLLVNPSWANETMLRILHESGFNSKSTFNEAFKRETGMTPSEYRRRNGDRLQTVSGIRTAACP